MMKKIYLGLAGIVPAVAIGAGALMAHADVLSTSTLGTAIDTVNGTFYSYFQVLLTNYWPFVVGAGVLLLVWHFGRRLLTAFN